jgi:hypothetical protein
MTDQHSPQEVAAKFIAKLEESPFIMIGLNDGGHAEPMNVKLDEDQPNALFVFSGHDNRIAAGGDAMAQFVGKGHDFFACLADARLNRFDVSSAELWETDVSLSGRVKMLFGGTIKPDESSSHAVVGSVG